MSVLKQGIAAVAGVYALLLVCDGVFGSGEPRFDDTYFGASIYAPGPAEFRFAPDTPPATRVSDAFAQFAPGEGKASKDYSSLPTILR